MLYCCTYREETHGRNKKLRLERSETLVDTLVQLYQHQYLVVCCILGQSIVQCNLYYPFVQYYTPLEPIPYVILMAIPVPSSSSRDILSRRLPLVIFAHLQLTRGFLFSFYLKFFQAVYLSIAKIMFSLQFLTGTHLLWYIKALDSLRDAA